MASTSYLPANQSTAKLKNSFSHSYLAILTFMLAIPNPDLLDKPKKGYSQMITLWIPKIHLEKEHLSKLLIHETSHLKTFK